MNAPWKQIESKILLISIKQWLAMVNVQMAKRGAIASLSIPILRLYSINAILGSVSHRAAPFVILIDHLKEAHDDYYCRLNLHHIMRHYLVP